MKNKKSVLLLWAIALLLLLPQYIEAQTVHAPSFYGGNKNKTIELRKGQDGSIRKVPVRDYVKYNARYRSMLPTRRKCSTLEMEQDRDAKGLGESKGEFENWLNRNRLRPRSMRSRSAGIQVFTIPVVVHIVYSRPTENISMAQIQSQITSLNQDYRRKNPDAFNTLAEFKKKAVDCGIEFCLANIDPNGNPTDGVNRVSMGGSPFTDRYINEIIKPNTIWNPNEYMNIWVCNITGGILGYAQFPTSSGLDGVPQMQSSANTDGVVIHFNAMGTIGTATAPFNKGRTATHEVGHWLGLRHIWGDGPCGSDDFCKDTPEAEAAHFSCPTGVQGCFGQAMFQNFMDYTDDACMNMFTRDQALRMRMVLQNSPRRSSLVFSPVCAAPTKVPEAEFAADLNFGGAPLKVNFADLSKGDPTSWKWAFEGGDPLSSTKNDPEVTFNRPGIYAVSLKSKNRGGTSPIANKQAYITVFDKGVALPYAVNFDNSEELLPNGYLIRSNKKYTWENSRRVGGFGKGSGAVMFNNFDNNLRNGADWMITPPLDFSSGRDNILNFDMAYARHDGFYSDTLGIFISEDGGSSFHAIFYRGGTELATAEDYLRPFTPFPNEWKKIAIDLSAYDNNKLIQIAFVNFSGFGNNLFLDNIKIDTKPKPLPEVNFTSSTQTVCMGGIVKFTDQCKNANKLSWTFEGGVPASSSAAQPHITYAKAGTYEVILLAKNASGSKLLKRKALIEVKPAPDLFLNKSEAHICLGSSVLLSAARAQKYEWSPKKGLSKSRGPIVEAAPTVSTVYMLKATARNGCVSSRSVNVQVHTGENFSIEPAEATVCSGQSVRLTARGAGTFEWEPAMGLNKTTGHLVSASPKRTTTYTVTGRNAGGCEFKKQIKVEVESAPSIFATAEKKKICPGEQVRIRAGGADKFAWTLAGSDKNLEGNEILVSPQKTTTYTVNTGSIGCFSTAKVKIEVSPKPRISAEKALYRVCSGRLTNLKVTGDASSYRWLAGKGLDVQGGETASAFPTQSTTYTVIGSNEGGCTDTARFEMLVNPTPKVEIINSRPTLCRGETTRLTASGGVTYSWSPAEGLSRTYGDMIFAHPSFTTLYTVTAEDELGCVAQQSVTVNIGDNQPPIASFAIGRRSVCQGETIQFVDRSRSATSYAWEFPGGKPSFSSKQNPTITYHRPGNYDVILRVRGCVGQDEKVERSYITVKSAAQLTVNRKRVNLCKGDSTWLEASGMQEYRWEPRLGLSHFVGDRVQAFPQENTTYTLTAIDRNGCQQEEKINILVKGGKSNARIQSRTTHVCAGEEVRLTAGGANEYVWFEGKKQSLGQGEEIVLNPTQSATYRLEARDAFGCVSRDVLRIAVQPKPSIALTTSDSVICRGDTILLRAAGGVSYNWISNSGLIHAEGATLLAAPMESGIFSVKAKDEFGCHATASVSIRVKEGKALSIAASSTRLCLGKSANLMVSGGQNYIWSGTVKQDTLQANKVEVSPTQTTTYSVSSLDEDGCPSISSITIEVSEPGKVSISPQEKSICPGEEVRLFASGARSYQWDSHPELLLVKGKPAMAAVKPSQSTTFHLWATGENGCAMEGVVTIVVRPASSIELSASITEICQGEEVELTVSGGKNYKWAAAPGLNPPLSETKAIAVPDESTTYVVTGEDSTGCKSSASISINVSTFVTDFKMSKNKIDLATDDAKIVFTDLTEGATSWKWDFGDGSGSEEANPVHFFTKEGKYEVVLIVGTALCEAELFDTVHVHNSCDLQEIIDEKGITISRTDTVFNVKIVADHKLNLTYKLLNSTGETIISDQLKADHELSWTLNLSAQPKGTYTLEITDGKSVFRREILWE